MDREHKTVRWIVVGRPQGVHVGVIVLELTLLAVFVGLAGYALFQLLRRRAPKFEDLDRDEQRRREEAGRMLHAF